MIQKLKQNSNTQDRRFLRIAEVKQQVGLGRSSIYSKIKCGEFPAPVTLGARAVAWLSDEITAWIDGRVAASRASTVERT